MRIVCVGGGPAGLFLSILLKKQNPLHEITVLERNGADDTFGWGVVFSEETLSHFAHADAETYEAITQRFVRWTDLVIRDRGQVTRSTGHTFAGLSRKVLLNVLQERAYRLGVSLRFGEEVGDVEAWRQRCDVLIGCDGLNSAVRRRYEASFQPSLDVRKANYIWLGTPFRLDDFTFIFRENEHGLFQVHAYGFDRHTSTFIVECDDDTWRRSGLDTADEMQSIDYLQKLFAEDLGGHPLLGNRSRWVKFTTVKNARWRHENVVLLGDAAHTAHFSIGSGTKLAMEDSIALAAQLRDGVRPEDAIERYEAERRPQTERIQRAAQRSLEWFEDTKRHHEQPPLQMAFSCFTRSARITHANLRIRDGAFVDEMDRWFAAQAGVPAEPGKKPTPPAFTPLTIRELTLPNRIAVSPMCMYSAHDGLVDDFHLVHLGSRAMGGAGLVMTEMTDVSPEGRITQGCAGLWTEAHRDAWARIVRFVHAQTHSKIGIQLAHAGRKGSCAPPWEGGGPLSETAGAWQTLAPSALPFAPGHPAPRAMTADDLTRIRDAFARAARWADEAGFDLVELHAAHGYLLHQFLSPISNRRDDAYGGSRDKRFVYPLEVFDAVRSVWPSHKPLAVRLSATDWTPGGFDADDAVAFGEALKAHGCDLVDVSTGGNVHDAQVPYGRMYQTPFSDRIRNEVGIRTMSVGAITNVDEIQTILVSGRADMCMLAREHLRDPYFALHAATEAGAEVAWPKQYRLGQPRPR